MRWPLKFTVQTQGDGHWEIDGLGNDKWVPGVAEDVKVFAFEVIRSEERVEAGHPRLVEDLRIYAPPGSFAPEKAVTLPDGTVWEIDGNPEDVNNNPYWSPGLVTYHARKM